jgi:hypothetical protein
LGLWSAGLVEASFDAFFAMLVQHEALDSFATGYCPLAWVAVGVLAQHEESLSPQAFSLAVGVLPAWTATANAANIIERTSLFIWDSYKSELWLFQVLLPLYLKLAEMP